VEGSQGIEAACPWCGLPGLPLSLDDLLDAHVALERGAVRGTSSPGVPGDAGPPRAEEVVADDG
jgi:hypothetical protein